MTKEVKLEPGWLLRDVRTAAARMATNKNNVTKAPDEQMEAITIKVIDEVTEWGSHHVYVLTLDPVSEHIYLNLRSSYSGNQ